ALINRYVRNEQVAVGGWRGSGLKNLDNGRTRAQHVGRRLGKVGPQAAQSDDRATLAIADVTDMNVERLSRKLAESNLHAVQRDCLGLFNELRVTVGCMRS